MDSNRNEHGQYRPTFSDEDIIDAVQENEPASTSEVAEAVGYEQRSSAEYRLKKLRDEGRVSSKKVGRTLVWMVSEGDSTQEVNSD